MSLKIAHQSFYYYYSQTFNATVSTRLNRFTFLFWELSLWEIHKIHNCKMYMTQGGHKYIKITKHLKNNENENEKICKGFQSWRFPLTAPLGYLNKAQYKTVSSCNSFCPNVGVPESRGDLTLEAATERLPGRRRPQAKWDSWPQGVTEGNHSKDGDARETE